MKIIDVKVDKFDIKLKDPITVALGTVDKTRNVLVEIKTDEGLIGIGEGAPLEIVTGDTQESILAAIDHLLKPVIIGEDPRDMEKLQYKMNRAIKQNTSAKAAVDIALYDLLGKMYKTPVYKLLGGNDNLYESDLTIGIDDPNIMGMKAKGFAEEGYSFIKVKVGIDTYQDIKRVKRIREAVGPNVKIRLDANQGWNAKEAVHVIRKLEEYDIELVEQPVPRYDIKGLAFIRNRVDVPIMADESVFSTEDAMRLIKEEAVDLINIKLMKAGGLFNAKRICDLAEAANIECMVGCMIESRIGITAAAHLVAASRNITRVDLDAPLYLKDDPVLGGVYPKPGKIYLTDDIGLGVSIKK